MAVSYRYALFIGALSFVAALLFATPVARVFDSTPEVVDTVVLYLRIVALSWGLLGVMQLAAAAFNALAKPLPAMVLSILRMVALYVPLAYLGSLLFDIPGIFGATFLANAAAGIAALIWLRRTLGRITPPAVHPPPSA
jgi:Na+-driven multidrug efflux pump